MPGTPGVQYLLVRIRPIQVAPAKTDVLRVRDTDGQMS